jgi:4-amino-4-deoxy-L-arabinose transferase-like glycosyltransferase
MFLRKIVSVKGLVIALIGLALLVRLVGLGWGLPYAQYHVDEQGFGKFTIRYFTGDLDPHFFEVPSLYTYLTAAVWEGYYLGGKAAGTFVDHASFIKAYGRDSSVFILLGRLLTVLFGVGTVLLVFGLGRRMYGTRAGALAAILLIFSLEHVKQSHYFIPDVAMVFFLMLGFFFVWSIYTTGKARFYILAGLCAGLAYATKYSGHFLALPLLLAHFFRSYEKKEPFIRSLFSPKLLGALAAFFGGFLIGCPYAVLDKTKFLKDFRRQASRLFAQGHFGSSTAEPTWLFYLKYGLRENIGRVAQFLVPAGVLYALLKHRRKDILLLSLPLTLFVIMGTMKSYATRYLLPLAPFFALLAALFLDWALDGVKAGLARLREVTLPASLVRTVQAGLVLAVVLPSAWQTARYDQALTWTDTRTVAKDWIEANIPRGERIASESYRPPLKAGDYKLLTPNCLGDVGWDWLARRRVRYVIVNDIMYQRFLDAPADFPKQAAFYRSLDERATLIKVFAPRRDDDLIDLHNPTIKIYRIDQDSAPGR